MSLYPEVLGRVRNACSQYRERIIDTEEFQSVVRQAEEAITAHEERELRKLFNRAENNLELIRFTINEANVFQESIKIVRQLEDGLKPWEDQPP